MSKTLTKGAPKTAPEEPSQDYINKGIQDAQNYANKGVNLAKGASKYASNPTAGAGKGIAKGAKNAFNRLSGRNKTDANTKPTLRQKVGQKAKSGVKKAANKTLDKGLRTAGNFLTPVGRVAIEAVILVKNSALIRKILAYAGAAIVLFLLLWLSGDGGLSEVAMNQYLSQQNQTPTPTTSENCNPQKVSNGQKSVCTITVTYLGSADDIAITDTILAGTTFVSAGQGGKYDSASKTVTWDAKKLKLPLNPVEITVTVTVRVTTKQNNVKVWNAYSINPTNLSGGSSGTGGGAIPSGGNYNTRTWAIALLKGLGIPQSTGAIAAVMHWEQEEGGNWHNQAKYNPLNTTEPMPGSSTFQSVGAGAASIRIYTSWQQGLEATVKTLENGNYGPILTALKSGNYNAVGQAVLASPWGTTQW